MNATLAEPGSAGTVFALLLCGHALAEFVVQSRRGLERTRTSFQGWARHVVLVFVTQAAVLLPYVSIFMLGLLGVLALTHGLIDGLKIVWERRAPHSLAAFLTDQGLHLLSLLGVARIWWVAAERSGQLGTWEWELALIKPAILIGLLALNGTGGSAVVTSVLRRFNLPGNDEEMPAAGRTIGMLERWLAVLLVWVGQWGILGLILAAKSIARFKDLEERRFSEYYLIGTLTSMLVAVGTTLLASTLAG